MPKLLRINRHGNTACYFSLEHSMSWLAWGWLMTLCMMYREGNISMTVFHKNTWRPESLETCFSQLSWYRCECISRESFKVWNNRYFIMWNMRVWSPTGRVRLGKGRGQNHGEHQLKSRPQQSWISTVNMLAGNWENLKAVLGFIISIHIIKPQSKQDCCQCKVVKMKRRLYQMLFQSLINNLPFWPWNKS